MSIALFQKNKVITESVYSNRFLFQGREYDYATQLYYFRNRWYEPETGRWLSPDPIGISGGLNLYAFCENDPVNYIDPDGLWQLTIGLGYGFAAKFTIGHNNGKWNAGGSVGIGKGFEISYDGLDRNAGIKYETIHRAGLETTFELLMKKSAAGVRVSARAHIGIECRNVCDCGSPDFADDSDISFAPYVFFPSFKKMPPIEIHPGEYSVKRGNFSPSEKVGIGGMLFWGAYYNYEW